MWRADAKGSLGKPRREVALLLLASFFVVAALVVAIADGGTIPLSAQARSAFLHCHGPGRRRGRRGDRLSQSCDRRDGPERGDAEETAELRKNLLTAEAIIKAEPQVLVFWEQGQGVRVMAHTLGRRRRPAAAACRAAEVRQVARPRLGAGAQERARRAVLRRAAVQLAAQDDGGRPCRGGRAGGRRAGDPAPARHRRAQARPRPHPRSAPPAGARYAGRAHAAQRAADAGLVPRFGRAHPMGQRGLCEGRRGQQRERGARAPDRASGDAPARGGCVGAGQGHTLPRARAPHQRRGAQGARRRRHPARGRQRRRGHRRGGAGDGAGRAGAARGGLRAHARPGGHRPLPSSAPTSG